MRLSKGQVVLVGYRNANEFVALMMTQNSFTTLMVVPPSREKNAWCKFRVTTDKTSRIVEFPITFECVTKFVIIFEAMNPNYQFFHVYCLLLFAQQSWKCVSRSFMLIINFVHSSWYIKISPNSWTIGNQNTFKLQPSKFGQPLSDQTKIIRSSIRKPWTSDVFITRYSSRIFLRVMEE